MTAPPIAGANNPPNPESRRTQFIRYLTDWGDFVSLLIFLLVVGLGLAGVLKSCPNISVLLIVVLLIVAGIVTLATLSSIIADKTRASTNPQGQQLPATSTSGELTRWISPSVLVAVLLYLGLRQICPAGCPGPCAEAAVGPPLCAVALPIAIILILVVGLLIWFVHVFSQEITPGPIAIEKEIIPMVRFCYVFTIAAFAISVAPLLGILSVHHQLYFAMLRSPIGVVKGCVHSKNTEWELACSDVDPYKAQWILNVGGSARFAHQMPTPSASDEIAAAAAPSGIGRCCTATPTCSRAATPTGTPTATSAPTAIPTYATTTATPSATPTMDAVDRSIRYEPSSRPIVIVHGGLVVPWYFIALAIMGAAVSLARRVPEYQRRAISAGDSMDGATAREEFEFQVLQVLSAPLIALAAYNLVTPTNIATSALLGFSAGFSSETILLTIRKMLDGMLGTATSSPTIGTSDAALTSAITALLFKDPVILKEEPDLESKDIEIVTQNGVVTLSGSLHNDVAINRAVELTKKVPGVKDVTSRLAKISRDPEIISAIASLLFQDADLRSKDPDLKATEVKIESQDGVVTLTGSLKDQGAIDRAVDLAKNVRFVTTVSGSGLKVR